MPRFWIAVAYREHVQRGVEGGFAQVCHGKATPLQRMRPGDWLAYYSSVERLGEKAPCRRFTAVGIVGAREPYTFAMSETFVPFRRDVAFVREALEADVAPLVQRLSFIPNKARWGFPFMRGCFEVPDGDFVIIAEAMGVRLAERSPMPPVEGPGLLVGLTAPAAPAVGKRRRTSGSKAELIGVELS